MGDGRERLARRARRHAPRRRTPREQNVLLFDGLYKDCAGRTEAAGGRSRPRHCGPRRSAGDMRAAPACASTKRNCIACAANSCWKRDPANPAPAEEAFQTAIAVAKRQGDPQLRTTRGAFARQTLPIDRPPGRGPRRPRARARRLFADVGNARDRRGASAARGAGEGRAGPEAVEKWNARAKMHVDYARAVQWAKGWGSEEARTAIERAHEFAAAAPGHPEYWSLTYGRFAIFSCAVSFAPASTILTPTFGKRKPGTAGSRGERAPAARHGQTRTRRVFRIAKTVRRTSCELGRGTGQASPGRHGRGRAVCRMGLYGPTPDDRRRGRGRRPHVRGRDPSRRIPGTSVRWPSRPVKACSSSPSADASKTCSAGPKCSGPTPPKKARSFGNRMRGDGRAGLAVCCSAMWRRPQTSIEKSWPLSSSGRRGKRYTCGRAFSPSSKGRRARSTTRSRRSRTVSRSPSEPAAIVRIVPPPDPRRHPR